MTLGRSLPHQVGGRIRPGGAVLVCLLVAACRPGPPPGPQGPIPLRGLYAFEGRVHGRNQYRYRGSTFTRTIQGTVEFLPDEVRVYFGSEVPTCVIPREDVRILGTEHVQFSCNARLEFANGWGRATLGVTEEREERGECSDWEILPDGRRGRCLEWIWLIRSRTTRKSTPLTVRRISGNPP